MKIIRIAKELIEEGVNIFIRWVLSHINIEGNEKANVLAKKNCKSIKKYINQRI